VDKGLCLEAVLHVKGGKAFSTTIPNSSPTLLDVIQAFPSVDISEMNSMVRGAMAMMLLPTSWVLECSPCEKGFRLTLDIHPGKHWEKEFEVTSMQLAEMVDILDWVKEANKIDRAGLKR
jgi:hypothetical protein